jgi:hypothetical protein
MKKLCYALLLTLVLTGITEVLHAHHWRVNNAPNASAQFTSLQAAHDSPQVAEGDTLYLEPSVNSYGSITWTKRLVMIGNGYYLTANPETQANTTQTSIGSLDVRSGASGSVVSGCTLNNISLSTTNTIFFKRNYIINLDFSSGSNSNIYFYQNVIEGIAGYGWGVETYFENNILFNVGLQPSARCTFLNNVILYIYSVYNSTLANNIMTTNQGFGNISTCNYYNNISAGTQFGTDNGNQANVDMNNVFVCWNSCTGISPDAKFQLKPGSVAAGAGYGGIDCGIFAGNYPYVLSGMPNIPAIYYLNTQPDGNMLDVNMKIKSHN